MQLSKPLLIPTRRHLSLNMSITFVNTIFYYSAKEEINSRNKTEASLCELSIIIQYFAVVFEIDSTMHQAKVFLTSLNFIKPRQLPKRHFRRHSFEELLK